jgi:hypothetical protein
VGPAFRFRSSEPFPVRPISQTLRYLPGPVPCVPLNRQTACDRGSRLDRYARPNCPPGNSGNGWSLARNLECLILKAGIVKSTSISNESALRSEPQNRPSFPLDRAIPPPKKGAAVSPLNCRVKIPPNQSNGENNPLKSYFLEAWTPFLRVKKLPSSDWQTGHFTGLFEIRSCLLSSSGVAQPVPATACSSKSSVLTHPGARSCSGQLPNGMRWPAPAGPLRGDRPAPGFRRGWVGPGPYDSGVAGALSGTAHFP